MVPARSGRIRLFVGFAAIFGVVVAGLLSCARSGGGPSVTLAVALLPAEQPAYRALLEQFQQQHGISVNLIAQQYTEIRQTVEAEVQGGGGELDVVEADVFNLGAMQDLVQPVTVPEGELDVINPDALAAGRFDGQQKFVPHRLNWQAIIYNTQEIPEPPADWQQLRSTVEAHTGRFGLKASRYEGLTCDVLPYVWQAGGDPLQPDSEPCRAALRFLSALAPDLNSSSSRYNEGSILTALEQDEVFLEANWSFVVPQLRQKGLMPGKFATAPLPAGPKGRATVLGGGYLAIPKTAPHPAQAAELIAFLISADGQRKLVGSLGWFPVRPEGWDALSEADRELFAGFIAMQDHVHARPTVPYYDDLSAIWQEGARSILFEGAAPDAVAVEMQEKIDRLRGA